MAEKILNTRIALKYDTLANWLSSSLVLKTGEMVVAEIPSASSDSGLTPPAIGIKVGDGTKTFSQLGWIQAIAGDVQLWAKAATKPSYTSTEISAEQTSGDGKTVESRLQAIESGFIGGAIYRVIKDDSEEKWYLQSKPSSSPDTEYTTISTINLVDILAAKQDNLTFNGTYNASTNKVATESTVSNAIAALDGSITGTAGISKTLTALTETNGVINATFGDINITANQVSNAGTAITANIATSAITDGDTGTDLTSKAQVATYVAEKTAGLTGAMHFKGSVDSIPPASGTYVSGDVVFLTSTNKEYIYDGTNWILFGDEGSYALKTIEISGGSGLTGGGTLETNRTIAHAVPSGAGTTNNISATDGTFINSITFDSFGHVTSVGTGSATTYTFAEGSTNGAFSVTPAGGSAQSVSIHGLGEAAFVDMADAIANGDTGAATGSQVYNYINTNLATIAKTGNVNDLIQTSGDVLVLNCGSATTVI